jgi:kynureninase
MHYEPSIEFAMAKDAADPLFRFRNEFVRPGPRDGLDCVYLCGNSLGIQPKRGIASLQQEIDEWARLGVEGHFQARRPWLSYHKHARRGLSVLTGATENEVVAMHSLTVNLHLLMASFYRPVPGRSKILIEAAAFPSDRFAVMSQIRMRGFDVDTDLIEWSPPPGKDELMMEDFVRILEQHGDEIALILLPGVQYYSGQLLDMKTLCSLAADAGCTLGLDLAHAIGNVPLSLHEWSPDFAAWCSYKYLNGGPGCVGGAFVAERHLGGDGSEQLLGWWGHDEATRLKMSPEFVAEKGADLWQLSCPAVFAVAPLLGSLELFLEAGIDAIRDKSLELTGYLEFLLTDGFAGSVTSITPAHARGAQLSMTVVETGVDPRAVLHALEEKNVIVDWREPNVIRVAPAPLYNSYEDVFLFSERLNAALLRCRPGH